MTPPFSLSLLTLQKTHTRSLVALFLMSSVCSAPCVQAETPKNDTHLSDKIGSAVHTSSRQDGMETIESALEAAYLNNPELAAEVSKLNRADEEMPQAKSGYRPKITGNVSVGMNQTIRSGDYKRLGVNNTSKTYAAPKTSAGFEVSQNLYAGGRDVASIKRAEHTIKATRARLLATEQKIFSQVIQNVLDIVLKESELDLYEGNLKLLSQTLSATRSKFDVGEETRTAVAQAEAEQAEAFAQLETTRAELEGLKATFKRLTGRFPRARIITPNLGSDFPQTLEAAMTLAGDNNPAIIAARFDAAAARYNVDRVASGLHPSIDLKASGSFSGTKDYSRLSFGDLRSVSGDNRASNVSADLVMTVPIYEQGLTRSQKRAACDEAAGARIAVETQRRVVLESLIKSWENYTASKANLKSYETQVKSRRVSLEGTREEMNVGTKIILDVLNSQKELLRSELNLVRARRLYLFEAFQLYGWMGRLTAKSMKLNVKHYDPSVHYHATKGRF